MTNRDKIRKRLEDSRTASVLKNDMYKLRRVVVGDYVSIGGDKISVKYDDLNKTRKDNKMYPTFRPSIYEEGVGNHLYEWLKILVMQTVLSTPQVDFPDLEPTHSKVRESYLLDRLARNRWEVHQEKALFHFLIDGMGWLKLGLRNDLPAVRVVDTLRLLWDVHADFPSEIRFMAEELSLTIDEAKELIGPVGLAKIYPNQSDKTGEAIVHVLEYWDKDTLAYVTCDNFEVLKSTKNPFGFVPFVCIHGPHLPSINSPMPHIVSVIGAQTSHAALQRSINNLSKKMTPMHFLNPKAFTPESWRMYQENPDDLTVLVLANNTTDFRQAVQVLDGAKVTNDALALKQDLEKEIVQHLGVNPFAAGSTISPDFATEVTEISQRSGLNASFIASKLSLCLSDAFRKLVKIGAQYDDEEFLTRLDGDLAKFRNREIKPLLADDVPCFVKPGSFETDEIKLIKASNLLRALLQDPVMSRNNKLRTELWATILQGAGYKDIDNLVRIDDQDQLLNILEQAGITSPDQLLQVVQSLQANQAQPQQV